MSDFDIRNSKKRIYVLTIVICSVIFALSSFLIKPLNISFSTDIMLMDSWVMYVFDVLLVLCEVAAYSVMFAAVIFFVLSENGFPKKLILICALVCALRRFADIIMTVIFYGALSLEDLYLVIFYIAVELLQIFVVWFLTKRCKNVFSKEALPLKKPFDKENPLQVSALLAGAFLSLVKVVSRIIYDISYSLFVGPPQNVGEILAMAIYYLSDIAITFISYALILLTVKLFVVSRK